MKYLILILFISNVCYGLNISDSVCRVPNCYEPVNKLQEALYIQLGGKMFVDQFNNYINKEFNKRLYRYKIDKEYFYALYLLNIYNTKTLRIPLKKKAIILTPIAIHIEFNL